MIESGGDGWGGRFGGDFDLVVRCPVAEWKVQMVTDV